MEIARDIFLNKLISKKNNGLIKVVTGMRRCGKSYLLFNLFRDHLKSEGVPDDHVIEMAFDSFENKKYRDPEAFYQYLVDRLKDDSMYYVLLDEVQLLDDFEDILNSLARRRNTDVYVTGSNAKFLSKDIITEFRGRGDEVRMYPLTFSEYMTAYTGDRYQGWRDYVLYGGLPLIFSFQTPDQKSDFLKALFEETYISDITGRNNIRNKDELEELLNILSSAMGSLTNPNKLSSTFKTVKNRKISPTTIKRYIDYLCDAFLIDKAIRYDIKGKKYIDTPAKYYFTDLGLRNARLNFRQVEETHAMENVIFNELKVRGYNVDVGIVPVSEKNRTGKSVRKQLEIDFVCNRGSKRYYIQSAFAMQDEEKEKQEQRLLLSTGDGFKKIIITKDALAPLYNENGILVMSIFDFLLDPHSLEI
ncbi:MAG: ATP-binding protein [Mobilibacterium timonense]|uniref:ATP-binding protein n=1 Tax=Mobilibacterium timonense TaxID=1871012 RepID=UPI0023559F3D|nr:ATP-binding protein [Mobilibacterium timonense]MBM6990488.1 ATP-binding protein [Mobilibacterium timonense]